MKKVTILKANGQIGILTKADDGKWDIEMDGKKMPANYHYDDAQVEKIIADSKRSGAVVTIVK